MQLFKIDLSSDNNLKNIFHFLCLLFLFFVCFFDGIDFSFNGMPSWSVVKLSSSYEFSNKFKTLLVLDNVFDIHFREFASGISAPGRNLNLVLSYKF